MLGKSDDQAGFFGDFLYDQVLAQDFYLRKLKALVVADRINEDCRNLYSDMGRPGWEPALLFRMLLLQAIHEIPSSDIEEQVNMNLGFKWFVGLEANAKAPDVSTLTSFKDRLGPERFNGMIGAIVDGARDLNLLSQDIFIAGTGRIRLQGESYRIRKEGPKNDDFRRPPPSRFQEWLDAISARLKRLSAGFRKPKDPQPKLKL